MDFIIILQAGVATGTVLLFATIGEIFAERSGVLNLGVEGMMLIGAMSAFSMTIATGNPWLGVLVAMLVAGLAQPDPCLHRHHPAGRSGGQRTGAHFLGHRHQPGVGRGLEQGRHGLAAAQLFHPAAFSDPDPRADLLHQPKRAGLYRLSAHPAGMVLHQSHPPRPAPARGR